MTFSERLRAVMRDEPPSRWAERHHFRPSTVHEWLENGRVPRDASMDRLVQETGISDAWWLRGEGAGPAIDRAPYPLAASSDPLTSGSGEIPHFLLKHQGAQEDSFARIPFFDVRASAGHGAFVAAGESERYYAFDREWLAHHVGIAARRLALIPVSGTSMEPDLRDGDLVMIDRGDVEVVREGVYVFELDDRLYVKRLSLHGDRLVVASSNGAYPTTELNTLQENPSFLLHGRVLGSPSFKRL